MFYLRSPKRSDPNDVLYRLAKDAAAVVTDDYPLFAGACATIARVPSKLAIPYYAVDSSCIVPMRCFEKREYAAYTIRPKIRKLLPQYLRPLAGDPRPAQVSCRRFRVSVRVTSGPSQVFPGWVGNRAQTSAAVSQAVICTATRASSNQPSENATSGLSPYLHFGHISSLEVALAVQRLRART